MHNELVRAIWKCPTIFLHQGNKGEAKQFLLSFLLCCRRGKKKELVSYFTVCLHNLCSDTHIVEMSDHEEIEPPHTLSLYTMKSSSYDGTSVYSGHPLTP